MSRATHARMEETGFIRGHAKSTDEFMEALSVLGQIQILAIINSYKTCLFLSFLKLGYELKHWIMIVYDRRDSGIRFGGLYVGRL